MTDRRVSAAPSLLSAVLLLTVAWPLTLARPQAAEPAPGPSQQPERTPRADTDNHPPHPLHEIDDAMIRLPLAAALGAALALRPRRRGTPRATRRWSRPRSSWRWSAR